MNQQKQFSKWIVLGILAAGFSACQGKNSPPNQTNEENSKDSECPGNNDQSTFCDPEESSQILHRVEPATEVSDVKTGEEGHENLSQEMGREEESQNQIVILESVNPIEIDSSLEN